MSFGQVTKTLGDFDTIKVYDKLSVKLVPSSENKIVIKGAREAELEAVNKNGILKLRMPFLCLNFIRSNSMEKSRWISQNQSKKKLD